MSAGRRTVFFLLFASLALVLPLRAQLVPGQYEDEAPLGTWNLFGPFSAQALGRGTWGFAQQGDVSAALANPALLTSLPKYAVTATGSYAWASLFRYSLVNTGVVVSRGNLAAGRFGLDEGAVSVRWGRFALAASAGLAEDYGRPGVFVGDESNGLRVTQAGLLREFGLGAGAEIGGGLAVGVGVRFVDGRLDREVVETSDAAEGSITITDEKHEEFRGLYVTGGLSWQASSHVSAALVVRAPYSRKAEASSLLRYQAPAAGTDIRTDATAENTYRQPWVAGAGVCARLSPTLSLVADAAWFGWSRYAVTYFDEPLARRFKDTVKAGVGLTKVLAGRLFGSPAAFPLSLGLSFDPQPMRDPRSSYLGFSAGTGLRVGSFSVDAAVFYGRESGSGNSLRTARAALTLTWAPGEE